MTSTSDLAVVVLAAGAGTRMKSDLPKVMHSIAGRPMISHVLAAAEALSPARMAVVVAPGMDQVAAAVAPHPTVVQEKALGTGDAVRAARPVLEGHRGDVLILYGDTPLITAETLARLLEARRTKDVMGGEAAVAVLGFRPGDPGLYARLILGDQGQLEAIVEARDTTAEQRAITLCNGGLMALDGQRLWTLLDAIDDNNAKGEFYLTDAVRLAREQGWSCGMTEAPVEELLGIDSRALLARGEALMQERLRTRLLEGGVSLVAPETVHLSWDTEIGRDSVVWPNVVFGPGARVGEGVTIRSFSHIEQTTLARGVQIGPFARLRGGADLGEGAYIGNFVEVKNGKIDAGAKASHLTYLGDVSVGSGANIGAGTITCNYDGFIKSRTEIGAGAFIGSNSALVAPVRVGTGAIVGAGSVITRDVPDDAIATGRGDQDIREGAAPRFRMQRQRRKDGAKQKSDKQV